MQRATKAGHIFHYVQLPAQCSRPSQLWKQKMNFPGCEAVFLLYLVLVLMFHILFSLWPDSLMRRQSRDSGKQSPAQLGRRSLPMLSHGEKPPRTNWGPAPSCPQVPRRTHECRRPCDAGGKDGPLQWPQVEAPPCDLSLSWGPNTTTSITGDARSPIQERKPDFHF